MLKLDYQRVVIRIAIGLAAVASMAAPRVEARSPQSPGPAHSIAPATAENSSFFVGDWDIVTVAGQNGATTARLSIKVDGGKITAEIDSPEQGHHVIANANIQKSDSSLVIAYTFDYQGMAVPVVLALTPGADATVKVQFDFANGAYQLPGTATRITANPKA